MFEQAVLANPSHRLWSTCAGVTAQALLVLAACLAPIVWPDILPRAQMLVSLVAPMAPERQQPAAPPSQPSRMVPTRPNRFIGSALVVPTSLPPHPVLIDDPPDTPSVPCIGCPVSNGNLPSGPVSQFIDVRPFIPAHPRENPIAAQPTPTAPIRLPGGDVRLAHPIHRVEPIYPHMAIVAHISGTVELEGIITTDGRIRDLHPLSGNPLLVPAALDAVRQWVYAPTLLNGKPVEVIAPISVIFRLDR